MGQFYMRKPGAAVVRVRAHRGQLCTRRHMGAVAIGSAQRGRCTVEAQGGQGTVECLRRQAYSIVPGEGQLYMGVPVRVEHLSAWGGNCTLQARK